MSKIISWSFLIKIYLTVKYYNIGNINKANPKALLFKCKILYNIHGIVNILF